MYCDNCKNRVSYNASVCKNCGSQLKKRRAYEILFDALKSYFTSGRNHPFIFQLLCTFRFLICGVAKIVLFIVVFGMLCGSHSDLVEWIFAIVVVAIALSVQIFYEKLLAWAAGDQAENVWIEK